MDGVTGEMRTAISASAVSPDGTRRLCSMMDIMAAFVDNVIQVWRITPHGLELEFQDISVPWGPRETRRDGDSAITFVQVSCDRYNGIYTYRPGMLELTGGGHWLPGDPSDWEQSARGHSILLTDLISTHRPDAPSMGQLQDDAK